MGLPVRPLCALKLLACLHSSGGDDLAERDCPTYPAFVVTRASTGIDDSSYPGLYSLISDYFGPTMRGKVYGLLQLSQPLGYMSVCLLPHC